MLISLTPLRFLLVEDQTIMREFLAGHLKRTYPKCSVAEFGTLADLTRAKLEPGMFDLAIVDLELPDGMSMEWVERWVSLPGEPKALILSSVKEDYVFFQALRSNIQGFVHKDDGTEALESAVASVLSGNMFYSRAVRDKRSQMQRDPAFFDKVLSQREQEVLTNIGRGLSNEEVAQVMTLRMSSVVDHKKNIMNKLGLHTHPELMLYAIQKGFSRVQH